MEKMAKTGFRVSVVLLFIVFWLLLGAAWCGLFGFWIVGLLFNDTAVPISQISDPFGTVGLALLVFSVLVQGGLMLLLRRQMGLVTLLPLVGSAIMTIGPALVLGLLWWMTV